MEKKLRIAICDCNKNHSKEIDCVLRNILFDECEYYSDIYTDSKEILQKIHRNEFSYDIIFLEIDFICVSGFEIAKKLRQEKNNAEIIFITKNESFIIEGYKYRAFDYLLKPVSVSHLSEVMHRFLQSYFIKDSVFCFKSGREKYNIRLENISHFFSNGRIITVISRYQECSYYGKIDDLENILPQCLFIRPHQSYFVNIEHVTSYTKESLAINGEINIPISRHRLTQTEMILDSFFRQRL